MVKECINVSVLMYKCTCTHTNSLLAKQKIIIKKFHFKRENLLQKRFLSKNIFQKKKI